MAAIRQPEHNRSEHSQSEHNCVCADPVDAPAWEQIAPEERAFLVRFARNYVTGRRAMCWSAHAIVKVGAVAAALAAIIVTVHQLLGLRTP